MARRAEPLLFAIAAAGCLSTPHLSPAPPNPHDGMVLIHGHGSEAAASHPLDKKGQGKGKGEDARADEPRAPPSAGGGGTVTAPPSPVTSDFWIDVKEVTARDYEACIAEVSCSRGCGRGGDDPVACVTRADAVAYCAWKGKRLPTDAEWTLAAAGSEGRPYPWGSAAPDRLRLNGCGSECAGAAMYAGSDGYVDSAPVGRFPLGGTVDGVLDLAGNVAEWVNAVDAVDTNASMVRGGSYADVDAHAVQTTAARPMAAGAAAVDVGFRCASGT
jgi:formylglycine-generating enzyme required for sulfatase activity